MAQSDYIKYKGYYIPKITSWGECTEKEEIIKRIKSNREGDCSVCRANCVGLHCSECIFAKKDIVISFVNDSFGNSSSNLEIEEDFLL